MKYQLLLLLFNQYLLSPSVYSVYGSKIDLISNSQQGAILPPRRYFWLSHMVRLWASSEQKAGVL